MRDLTKLAQYRDWRAELTLYGCNGGATEGMFRIRLKRRDGHQGAKLTVIAAAGEGWEHVSVSTPTRCPTWSEMEFVKRMFFEEHETAMQLHVPPSEHVNCHAFCLHLWRPIGVEIPRPPAGMVAGAFASVTCIRVRVRGVNDGEKNARARRVERRQNCGDLPQTLYAKAP